MSSLFGIIMNSRSTYVVIGCFLWFVTALAIAAPNELPKAENLYADAQQASTDKKPIVLFFTLPNCSYCRIVRYDYFLPLLKQRAGRDQPIIREISVTGQNLVTLFDGKRMTEAELAERYKVQMTPTVMFVNHEGELLTDSLLGGDHTNYVGVFDRSLEEARKKIAGNRVRVR
jgi:thioredoxin-related protein